MSNNDLGPIALSAILTDSDIFSIVFTSPVADNLDSDVAMAPFTPLPRCNARPLSPPTSHATDLPVLDDTFFPSTPPVMRTRMRRTAGLAAPKDSPDSCVGPRNSEPAASSQQSLAEEEVLRDLYDFTDTPSHDCDRENDHEGSEATVNCDGHYSLARLLHQAEVYFGDKKPSFCVYNKTAEQTRPVKLVDSLETREISFEPWGEQEYGFWVLLYGDGEHRIVMCRSHKYFVWEGVEKGFSKQVIATSITKSRATQAMKEDADHEESKTSRSFRARTLRQEKPYAMYKVQKQFDDKGVRATESDLEDILASTSSQPRSRSSPTVISGPNPKRRKRSSSRAPGVQASVEAGPPSVVSASSSVAATVGVSTVSSLPTILRTRIEGFTCASIPVFLANTETNDDLFASLQRKWSFKLSERQILYCVVHFPWLDNDKDILLQESDSDGFWLMVEEVRKARSESRSLDVDVQIITDD